MQAVVFHGIGDIRLDNVPDPKIKDDTDAIVRITSSAICGTDLHFVRGTVPGLKKGTVLGHEAVGIVEEIGKGVRNLRVGDRVVVPSTVGCGYCSYCRAGYFAKCDNANPKGNRAPTVFFGGPAENGGLDGLQAERARIPFANVGLVKLPESVTDDQAILISDIFPTAYFGARLAEVKEGDTVCVFGCGPVGSSRSGREAHARWPRVRGRLCDVTARDGARSGCRSRQLRRGGSDGGDRRVDRGCGRRSRDRRGWRRRAARAPWSAGKKAKKQASEFEEEVKTVAPEQNPKGENWKPGDGPSQVLRWAVEVIAKAGSLGIIGVYPPTMDTSR